jgi:hypothetical protein
VNDNNNIIIIISISISIGGVVVVVGGGGGSSSSSSSNNSSSRGEVGKGEVIRFGLEFNPNFSSFIIIIFFLMGFLRILKLNLCCKTRGGKL